MTYYDRLNAFFRVNEADPLPSSVQLVYLYLLHMSNQVGGSKQFRCSENRLANMTRLNKKTVVEARRVLEQEGFIKCEAATKRTHAGTLYQIIELDESAEEELPAGEPQRRLLEPPAPVAESNYLSVNSAEVLKAWQDCGGEKVKGFDLVNLENQYGAEALINFIVEAGRLKKYPRMNVLFLKSVISRRTGNGNSERRIVQFPSAEQQYAIVADELPAEYRQYQS